MELTSLLKVSGREKVTELPVDFAIYGDLGETGFPGYGLLYGIMTYPPRFNDDLVATKHCVPKFVHDMTFGSSSALF